jgi:hypothetical protein
MDFVERLFWTVAIFLGVHFIWLGWLEEFASLMLGTAVATVLAVGFQVFALRYWPYEEAD